jgi:hypothetical protein
MEEERFYDSRPPPKGTFGGGLTPARQARGFLPTGKRLSLLRGGVSVHERHKVQMKVHVRMKGGLRIAGEILGRAVLQGIMKVHDSGIVAVPEKVLCAVAEAFFGHGDSPLKFYGRWNIFPAHCKIPWLQISAWKSEHKPSG